MVHVAICDFVREFYLDHKCRALNEEAEKSGKSREDGLLLNAEWPGSMGQCRVAYTNKVDNHCLQTPPEPTFRRGRANKNTRDPREPKCRDRLHDTRSLSGRAVARACRLYIYQAKEIKFHVNQCPPTPTDQCRVTPKARMSSAKSVLCSTAAQQSFPFRGSMDGAWLPGSHAPLGSKQSITRVPTAEAVFVVQW